MLKTTYKEDLKSLGKKSKTSKKKEVKEMTASELYNELIDNELFTEGELDLLTNINGFTVETLNDAIYVRFGYRDYEQLTEENE